MALCSIPECPDGSSLSILYSQWVSCIPCSFQDRQSQGSQAFAKYVRSVLPCCHVFFNPSFAGVFFYLSSAVNPIIYNLLSRRFRAAFRNVISSSCKWCHSQDLPPGPPAQKIIFLTECHLVELTEETGPQFPCQSSIYNSHLSTAPVLDRYHEGSGQKTTSEGLDSVDWHPSKPQQARRGILSPAPAVWH